MLCWRILTYEHLLGWKPYWHVSFHLWLLWVALGSVHQFAPREIVHVFLGNTRQVRQGIFNIGCRPFLKFIMPFIKTFPCCVIEHRIGERVLFIKLLSHSWLCGLGGLEVVEFAEFWSLPCHWGTECLRPCSAIVTFREHSVSIWVHNCTQSRNKINLMLFLRDLRYCICVYGHLKNLPNCVGTLALLRFYVVLNYLSSAAED